MNTLLLSILCLAIFVTLLFCIATYSRLKGLEYFYETISMRTLNILTTIIEQNYDTLEKMEKNGKNS